MTRTALVDGNSLWWRTFSSTDTPRNSEYKFLEILCNLKIECHADVIVVWDSWCQWRRDIHPQYKNREKTEEDKRLRSECYSARDVFIQHLQYIVPCYFGEDSEADDVIVKLVESLEGQKIIYGSDHDLFQILSPDVSMRRVRFQPTRIEIVTYENFRELEGYIPEQSVWMQTLRGCNSDNIPGCRLSKKLIIKILDSYDFSCSIQAHGNTLISTKGWGKRWNNHFDSGQVQKNHELVSLGKRNIQLLYMYSPDKVLAEKYLKDRMFLTITHSVLEELM